MFQENVAINNNTDQRNPLSFANCLKLLQNLILSRDILFRNYKNKSLVWFSLMKRLSELEAARESIIKNFSYISQILLWTGSNIFSMLSENFRCMPYNIQATLVCVLKAWFENQISNRGLCEMPTAAVIGEYRNKRPWWNIAAETSQYKANQKAVMYRNRT